MGALRGKWGLAHYSESYQDSKNISAKTTDVIASGHLFLFHKNLLLVRLFFLPFSSVNWLAAGELQS
jgi:hypothetical protein